jgi:polar amino acid transport system substrate-binding protein
MSTSSSSSSGATSGGGSSRRNLWIVVAVVVILIVVAALFLRRPSGGAGSPTATPPAPGAEGSPTAAQVSSASSAGQWDAIKTAGKMVVGTSADYPPFESYDTGFQPVGFDIALMQAIAGRLNLTVEFVDFAFDGLGGALAAGQIDCAIAAISVTPDREAMIDFTDVYFVDSGAALGRADAAIVLKSPEDLAKHKIGVQVGTVYEQFVAKNLVDTGKMPAANLMVYPSVDNAIGELATGQLDLVLLDLSVAQTYAAKGDVKVVGQGYHQQYAIAVPKGAAPLRDQLNATLGSLRTDGTLAQLTEQYLGVSGGGVPTSPTAAPPVASAVVAPTTAPAACYDGLRLIADLTYDDKDMTQPPVLKPGQAFVKSWRVQNSGTCPWTTAYKLAYAGGSSSYAQMGGKPVAVSRTVAPGETYDISVNLVAPLVPGTFHGVWQMQNTGGTAFGQRLDVGITVPAQPTATPAATQTPAPNISFTVDKTSIQQGQCVTFTWDCTNVNSVYFYAEGEDWQDNGVAGQSHQVECPQQTTTYYLRVVKRDGSVDTREITVAVTPVESAPKITQFVASPGQMTVGQCATLQWQVQGNVVSITISSADKTLWQGLPMQGTRQDCRNSAGTVNYDLVATGPGGSAQARQYVTVVDPATATPGPTAAPEAPVINAFAVQPSQIESGQCIRISWTTSGGTSRVTVSRGAETVIDGAPLSGSAQDCPPGEGPVTYALVAANDAGQSVRREATVTISGAPTQNPLAGTGWTVTSVYDGSAMAPVTPGAVLTVGFGTDGSVAGSAGCNSYSAAYSVDGTSLTVSAPASTSQTCSTPEGVMEQEQAFLSDLQAAAAYALSGSSLTLSDAGGTPLLQLTLMPR